MLDNCVMPHRILEQLSVQQQQHRQHRSQLEAPHTCSLKGSMNIPEIALAHSLSQHVQVYPPCSRHEETLNEANSELPCLLPHLCPFFAFEDSPSTDIRH